MPDRVDIAPVALGWIVAALAGPSSSGQTDRLVLLSGGGSGGHVFPGMAVCEELAARGWRVAMVGRPGGIEEREALSRQIPFHALIALPMLGRGPWGRLRSLVTLLLSTLRALRLVRRLDPQIVLGTGGYLSAPAALAGFLARRPVVLIEPNARPGLANRWLSRLAAGAVLAHQSAGRELRCRWWLTGVPVRAAFFAQGAPVAAAGAARLLVLGGSQGALPLNRSLPKLVVGAFGERQGSIFHQTGAGHLEVTREAYRQALPSCREWDRGLESATLRVELAPFVEEIAAAMGRSQLVVSRAGAVTLAEICAVGRAAVLVPLEIAAGHQLDNARALERAGAAAVVEQARLEELGPVLARLLDQPETVVEMGRRARALANPQAAAEIAEHLEDLLVSERAA